MYTKKREMFKKEFEKLSTKEINSKIADLERENTKIKEDVEKYQYPCTFLESDIQNDKKLKMGAILTAGAVAVGAFVAGLAMTIGDSQVAPEIQKSVLSVGTIGTAFVNEYVFSPIKKLFFETKAVLKRKKLDENMDKVVVATKLRVDKMDREI